MAQTNSGTIKFVNPDKGYGFIGRADGQRDVFFQVADLDGSLNFFASLAGTRVMFDIVETQTGPRAVNITRAE
jgi:cold shock CspA family protein